MTDKRIGPATHQPLEPAVVDRLLDLLSTDDNFRQKFQDDPVGALHELGHQPASAFVSARQPTAGQPFYCMTATKLASKEEFESCRNELKDYLTRRTDHSVVYYFEAGEMKSALRRK